MIVTRILTKVVWMIKISNKTIKYKNQTKITTTNIISNCYCDISELILSKCPLKGELIKLSCNCIILKLNKYKIQHIKNDNIINLKFNTLNTSINIDLSTSSFLYTLLN